MIAPTLLIGLGGKGSDIVARVSSMVSDEERKSISFAVLDTDINELREIKNKYPFVKTIQTSTRQTVGEYLNIDTHARDTWFPVNKILNNKVLSEGAGQVRSISRLAFETAVRSGKMEPLHEAIQDLYKVEENKEDQALRVIIVSSLCGGTGSGLILPVSLYVRHYLKTHYRHSANITRGFFILPEVFFGAIKGEPERDNFKANAYATIRELDAFLMKSDGTLPERYKKSVTIQFPKVAADGYENYDDVAPFDFCFLFDAQNSDGDRLNSFNQYLDHAATCIYAQSIGPMNKRSNSSEDNTIRKLAKERGRNRYAGAGVSMLVYPFEDIKKLFALKWAKHSVSSMWLKYDTAYFSEYKVEQEARRAAGVISGDDMSKSEYYVHLIEKTCEDDAFSKAIYAQSGVYTNGVTRDSDKSVSYIAALAKKIKDEAKGKETDLTSTHNEIATKIGNLGNDKSWKPFVSTFHELETYYALSAKYASNIAMALSYSLFRGAKKNVQNADQLDYMLDYYIAPNGQYLHPNAIRFILIKIAEEMENQRSVYTDKRKKLEKFFKSFGPSNFDKDGTDSVEDSPEALLSRDKSQTNKVEFGNLKEAYTNYLDSVDKYREFLVGEEVLASGIKFVKALVEAFELFYDSFKSKIVEMDDVINGIYDKYTSSKGTTVRYVCATRECMDKMYEKTPYSGSVIAIDSGLAKTIYDDVYEYSVLFERPNANRYFNELFDTGIIGYFEKSLMERHSGFLDVDVITALEHEADLIGIDPDEDHAYDKILLYVKKVLEDTKKLACPFIETPLGEAKNPIDSCAFNEEAILPKRGDESPRAQLIRTELVDFGGEADSDIDPKKIMFYRSFYGLRANDLSKFAPAEKSRTYDRSEGEYYKAYFDLIKCINPESEKSKGISPHCDRWWHNISKMPDLDEDLQQQEEYENYAAFFWALYLKLIYQTEKKNKKVYTFSKLILEMDDDTLIVSNGTDCDKLYEVLDAISIYPELADKIRAKVERDINDDNEAKLDFSDTTFMRMLPSFRIEEPFIGSVKLGNNRVSNCIFDIPLLMKKSATQDSYFEDDVINLLRVTIEEVKKYMLCFIAEDPMQIELKDFILSQFDMHIESLAVEAESNPKIFGESLFEKECDVIYKALYDIGCRKEANDILVRKNELKINGYVKPEATTDKK